MPMRAGWGSPPRSEVKAREHLVKGQFHDRIAGDQPALRRPQQARGRRSAPIQQTAKRRSPLGRLVFRHQTGP